MKQERLSLGGRMNDHPKSGTGFAYCPNPTRRSQRAYDTGRVYDRPLITLIVVGLCGTAWMIVAAGVALLFGLR